MGPIIILDKSAFQGLSLDEHFLLDTLFYPNLAPPLVHEILGDLSKQFKNNVLPEKKVQELSRKFGGSGGVAAFPADQLLVQALLGATVPMTGQIIPDNSFRAPDGGVLIDLSPLNHAILRWARGDFSEMERLQSQLWREVTRSPGFAPLWRAVYDRRIVIPAPENADALGRVVSDLVDSPGLQNAWIEILLSLAPTSAMQDRIVSARWAEQGGTLRTFAPYAHFSMRVWVSLVTAVHHRLLKWDPTHVIDVEYLYYLPFCQVFASDDRVHRLLAPTLLRANQDFVRGVDLKAAIRQEAQARDALEANLRRRLQWALSGRPLPRRDSLLHQLWRRHMRPWSGGPIVPTLDDAQERELALREARALFAEADGEPLAEPQ